jgi:hypothetical protein
MEYYLKSMVGSWGGAVLDFMHKQPSAVAAVLMVWLVILAAGKLQLRRIEQKSVELAVATAQELLVSQPHLTLERLYDEVYARWRAAVSKWALFVPHRLELWPVPATVETVQQKLAFSPEWLAEVLRQQGLVFDNSESAAHAH